MCVCEREKESVCVVWCVCMCVCVGRGGAKTTSVVLSLLVHLRSLSVGEFDFLCQNCMPQILTFSLNDKSHSAMNTHCVSQSTHHAWPLTGCHFDFRILASSTTLWLSPSRLLCPGTGDVSQAEAPAMQCLCAHRQCHVYTHTRAHAPARAHTHISHVYMHTNAHTHTHARTHVYRHTH